jgi:hypothetical protein
MSGIVFSYRLHRGDVWQVFEQLSDCPTAGAKNATFCDPIHLYIKTIILPRQARDKHRESSTQKRVALFSFLGV